MEKIENQKSDKIINVDFPDRKKIPVIEFKDHNREPRLKDIHPVISGDSPICSIVHKSWNVLIIASKTLITIHKINSKDFQVIYSYNLCGIVDEFLEKVDKKITKIGKK